jgi:hypothetical protein
MKESIETTDFGMSALVVFFNAMLGPRLPGVKIEASVSGLRAFLPPPPAYMRHGTRLFWLLATSCRSASPLLYIRIRESWCIFGEPSIPTLKACTGLAGLVRL